MSTKLNTYWSRLKGKMGLKSSLEEDFQELPDIGDDGLLTQPAAFPGETEDQTAEDRPISPLSRWSKRDQSLTKLQEGYERVTQLVENMQTHMAKQSERTEQICSSLDQLARSVSDMSAISRPQIQTLEAIVGQLEMANVRNQQLTESVSELPKVARAQSDTLAGINRQLEMAGEQNVVSTQTMEKLGMAIDTLGQSNQGQAEALKEMNARTNEHHDLLTDLIDKQNKRFTMLFVITIVLAIAAVAAAVVSLVLKNA